MSSVDELLAYKKTFDDSNMPFSVEDAVAAGFDDNIIDQALFPPTPQNDYLKSERITVFGKPVFESSDGELYSEITETIPMGTGFMAMPTIDPNTGTAYDKEYLTKWYKENGNVDPYSGEKLPVFGSVEEADNYAAWRSENQFNPALLEEDYYHRDSGLEFSGTGAELSAYEPTLREKAKYGLSGFLQNTFGMDNYDANQLAQKVTGNENADLGSGGIGLADFTPLGLAFSGQEAKRDFRNARRNSDYLGMGLAVGEGALAVAEAFPLTKAGVKIGREGVNSLLDLAKRIEVDPNVLGSNFGNVRLKDVDAEALSEVNATPEAATTLVEEALTKVEPGQPPKKTITAYRIYDTVPGTGVRVKNPSNNPPTVGRPLFVNKNDHFEEGQWYDAKFGEVDPETGKVKASLTGGVAPRPGFHSAEVPMSTHLGGMAIKGKKVVNYRKATEVWARVELPDDVPWQEEANRRMTTLADGVTPDLSTAEITDQLPVGGNYKYKTNPNMTGSWIISGSVKVDKFLSPDEAKTIARDLGVEDLPSLPELIDRDNLSIDDLTKSAQAELKRYYPDKYDELINGVKAAPQSNQDSGAAQAVLDIRAAQMELKVKDRIQPSGEDPMFDLSPESYEKTLPPQSETYVPRQPSGTNASLPKNDRGRAVNQAIEKISDRLAERMKPWLGTEAQYFYHTGPIVDKALEMGFSKEEIYDWMKEFADAYAATSPRTETAQNIRNATLVMTKRHLGIDLDEIIGPGGTGINEKGYPMMIGRKGDLVEDKDGLLKPLKADGIHRKLRDDVDAGGINPDTNPKPATFSENVYGNLDGVTVDTHAIRGALDAMNEINPGSIPIDYIKPKFRDQYKADPLSLNPATMIDDSMGSQMINGTKMQTEYAIFSDIYRMTAEKLGVSPAEAQSMGWFGSGDSTGLASELKSVARLLDERIDVTAQGLKKPKDEVFRMLLKREIPLLSIFPAAAAVGTQMGNNQQPELARGGFLDRSEGEKGIMSVEGQYMADEAFRLDRAKADLNDDGKLSDYELARGEAVQKAIKNDELVEAYHGGMPCGCDECDGSCGDEGMMPGSYYDNEEETGNPVPVGSLEHEVADDIPALLSEGEYVLPADVVRWHGLKHIQDMMVEAKAGLMSMDMMGQLHETEESYSEDSEDAEVSAEDSYAEEGQGELQEEYETSEGNNVEVASVDTEEEVLDEDEDEEATVVSYAFKSTPKVAFIR